MNDLVMTFRSFAEQRGLLDASFIVGGAVRDLLLDRKTKDFDIAVPGDAVSLARTFADSVSGSFVLLDQTFGIARVVRGEHFVDLCRLKGATIEEDLGDRDFTINAMALPMIKVGSGKWEAGSGGTEATDTEPYVGAYRADEGQAARTVGAALCGCPLKSEDIIDPFSGVKDLRTRTIRMVSEGNLASDPLRVLRAYRFAATLGFDIEVGTRMAMRRHGRLLPDVAVERVAEELRHLMGTSRSAPVVEDIEKEGLLPVLFPELGELDSEGRRALLQAYRYSEHVLNNLGLYFPRYLDEFSCYFGEERHRFCLKLAALLGDGVRSQAAALRLKLANKTVELTALFSAKASALPEDEDSMITLMRSAGDHLYGIVALALAANRVCQLSGSVLMGSSEALLSFYHDVFRGRQALLPLVTGDDLIAVFGMAPSPQFKEILDAVEWAVLKGDIVTRDKALAEVRKLLA